MLCLRWRAWIVNLCTNTLLPRYIHTLLYIRGSLLFEQGGRQLDQRQPQPMLKLKDARGEHLARALGRPCVDGHRLNEAHGARAGGGFMRQARTADALGSEKGLDQGQPAGSTHPAPPLGGAQPCHLIQRNDGADGHYAPHLVEGVRGIATWSLAGRCNMPGPSRRVR